jgi:hypothetical protein
MALVTFAPPAIVAVVAVNGAFRYIVAFICLGVAVMLVRRAFGLELIVGPETVEFQNFWRRYRVRWSDVEGVGAGSIMGLPAIAFVLGDGNVRPIQESSFTRHGRETVVKALRLYAPEGVFFKLP